MAVLGGAGLLVVNSLLSIPVVGWVLSAGMVGLGLTGLFGKTKTDKVSGTVLTAAGVLGGATLLLPHFDSQSVGSRRLGSHRLRRSALW